MAPFQPLSLGWELPGWTGWASEAVPPLPSCRSGFFYPHKRPKQSCLGEPSSPRSPGTESSPWLLSYLSWCHLVTPCPSPNSPRTYSSWGIWACLSPWSLAGEVYLSSLGTPFSSHEDLGKDLRQPGGLLFFPTVSRPTQLLVNCIFGQCWLSWLLLICANFSFDCLSWVDWKG